MRRAILLLMLSGAAIPGIAQLLPYHRYTSKDGLIADRITVISQDEQGVMWFGSYFGVGNYDGISFQKIRLPFEQENKFVTSLLPLGKKMYAGFIFGGGLAEIVGGRVKSFSILGSDPRTSNDITSLARYDDSSILLSNGKNELYKFSNGRFTFLYSLEKELTFSAIQGLYRDAHRNIWVSAKGGLFVIPSPGENGMMTFFRGVDILSFLPSANGKMWFATSEGSVYQCSGIEGNKLKQLSKKATITGLSWPGIRGNAQQGFWAIHSQKGLFNISEDGEVKYYPSALNPNADMSALFADREHNLWIANDPGLIKISNFNAVSWYFKRPAAAGGFILRDKQNVTWVNNSKELYRIEGDSISPVEFRRGDKGYLGKMLIDSSENLWIVRWNEGIWKTTWKKDRLINSKYFHSFQQHKLIGGALRLDAYGNIWFSGQNGIFRMKNGEVKERYDPVTVSGNHLFVNCILVDTGKKNLWLGDNAQGLIKVSFMQRNGNPYNYKIEKIIGPNEGLKDPYIRSMLMDHKGYIWVGTRSGGVYRVSSIEKDSRVEVIAPPNGFACSRITAIAEEEKKAIWFATCDGIYRRLNENGEWQHFDVSDGLLSAEVFHLAIDSRKSQVWAMTEQGITRIDYAPSNNQVISPLIHLKEVNVLGKPDTSALSTEGIPRYQYRSNSIGFVFAGSSYLNERKVSYRYMLEGYDKHWSEPVTTNAVNYASLAPGTYTFKVIAANAQGVWSETPATFTFQIILPFYMRTWFMFACLAMAGLLFYLVRVDRLKQQYRVEKLRMRIARDLHDDIGSALGSITLMSETANRKLTKRSGEVEIADVFNRIGNSAQSTLESMDDIIWSINPDKDKMGDLVIRMREFAIPILEAKEISFKFKVNAADYKKLPMNLRKNVFLIFKETIFNAVKHAGCTRVIIAMEIRNNIFCLEVKDNGKGFDPALPTERNGMGNMRKRSDLLGGTLDVEASPSRGTRVHFSCPIR